MVASAFKLFHGSAHCSLAAATGSVGALGFIDVRIIVKIRFQVQKVPLALAVPQCFNLSQVRVELAGPAGAPCFKSAFQVASASVLSSHCRGKLLILP
jgi:hypothetical protein